MKIKKLRKMRATCTAAMLVISIALSATAQTNAPATAQAAATRPNIVHIVADDLGMKTSVPLLPTDEAFYTDNDDDPTPPKDWKHALSALNKQSENRLFSHGPIQSRAR